MTDLQPPQVARALYYAQTLFSDLLTCDAGEPGRAYVIGRQIDPHLSRTAGLGYGVPGYSQILAGWGVTAALQLELGLVDEQFREVHVGRVTFPWVSAAGRRVIGIGGRAVDNRRPKYANGPERPWFAKGRTVYGQHQTAKAAHGSGYMVIVEGPFDAIALWRMGWTNTVATVGAKVTIDQLLIAGRLVDEVVVLLDHDEGGHRGREALAHLLATAWVPPALRVFTASLDGAKDAASPEATPEMVKAALGRALPCN